MFGIGAPELIMIAVAALIIFGPQRLPEIAGQVGKAIRDFRRMSDDLTGEFQRSMSLDEPPASQAAPLLTSETIEASSTPNGISDAIAGSLRVETVPPDAPETENDPVTTADTAPASASASTAEDTLISQAPVATKAAPLAGVSLLDEPTGYLAEHTGATAAVSAVAAAPYEYQPTAIPESAPQALDAEPLPGLEAEVAQAHTAADGVNGVNGIADAWDAVITTEATAATVAAPEAQSEVAAEMDPVLLTPEGYAYPPNTYQSGPIAFAEPNRERIDPAADPTIRETIEAQVASEAFRERRRTASYQRSRKKE